MENTKLYLKEVTLSGYKSINNVNISFKKGLNIIIGKNAAGKTNFLSFLYKVLALDYRELNVFESDLKFVKGNNFNIKANGLLEFDERSTNSKLDLGISITVKPLLLINNMIIDFPSKSFNNNLIENKIFFDNTFLGHGIPKNYIVIDTPLTFKCSNSILSNDLYGIINKLETPYFTRNLFLDIALKIREIKQLNYDNIRKEFNLIFRNIENIKFVLKQYSPIQDIQFSENYNLFLDENQIDFTVTNLFLEFKIDGNWLPFSSLSDGTKRLFYIISEVYENVDNKKETLTNIGTLQNQDDISRIILIEEPELGIHPHQFHQLMQFLKIESENKQIIITTHSPEALDALNKNELDRIIIASIKNSKEGTKLNHLNEEQIEKAKLYMDGDFLSDYWLYSDLEER